MGLVHHALVFMGDRQLFHPELNLSTLDTGCWHFDNGDISKFDDVLLEHGGLPHVLPIAVHLKFVLLEK